MKFILYTMAGSALMLLAILALYFLQDARAASFDYAAVMQLRIDPRLQVPLFLAFALAFAIKVPMVPFHTWLPDAHVEAPTAGSVILAGVLLKMGTYGFLRFGLPLFPDAAVRLAPVIVVLALVGHSLRRVGVDRPGRHEEAHRLLVRQPPRLRDARTLHLHAPGARGRHPPDGQPRALDRRALSPDRA